MHRFSTPWKPYDFPMFSEGMERVHWEQMGSEKKKYVLKTITCINSTYNLIFQT